MAAVESGLPTVQQEPPEPLQIVVDDEQRLSSSEHPPHDDVDCSSPKLSIYRIPHYLKVGNTKANVPQIVSLGPYHHGEETLRPMEQHKLRCLHRVLKRSNHEISLYLDSVKEVEERARSCYEGTISMSSDEFVHMLVLDGCFVIELFLGVAVGFKKLGYPRDDPVFSMREMILKMQQDMIMLENQIPLFILDQLLGLQLGDHNQKGRVAELAIKFFNSMHQNSSAFAELKLDPSSDHGGAHCLEVFRRSLLPLDPTPSETKQWPRRWKLITYCLTELRDAGIKIKLRYTDSWGDIKFKDRVLGIPQLVIHDGTKSLFLSLISFEQSHFDCSNYVTSYVIFMHNLIKSPEDVRYLRKRRIIQHCLGSDTEVVDLFNQLCRGVTFDIVDSYLYDLSLKVEKYFLRYYRKAALRRRWHGWRAILKNKYFDSPWSIISFIAASILLVLTFIQTLYAVHG